MVWFVRTVVDLFRAKSFQDRYDHDYAFRREFFRQEVAKQAAKEAKEAAKEAEKRKKTGE